MIAAWLLATAVASPETTGLAEALSRVDWLGWAASDRAVAAHLAEATRAEGPYAVAVRPDDRQRLDPDLPLYAVEATLADDVRVGGVDHVVVQLREAIVWRNRAAVPVHGLALRVFANGQDHRAHGVDIQGVWVDDRPARYTIDDTILSIELDEPLPPGRTARVLLHLLEQVPAFDPRGRDVSAASRDREIDPEQTGAFGRAAGWINLGYWLPTVTPVDRRGRFDIRPLRENTEHARFEPALYHVVMNVPAAYAVATTGVTEHQVVDGERATIVARAVARDFAAVLVPASAGAVRETTVAGTRIRVLHAGPAALGDDLLAYAERAFRVYTERFGPIGAAEVDLVEAPIRTLAAIGYPGLVLVDATHQGDQGLGMPYHRTAAHEWAVAHEIAHQWWGVDVGSDPALEPWVDEALASHAATVYWRARYGQDAVDARLRLEVFDRMRRLRRAGRPDLPADLSAWQYDLDQYAAIVYGRGSMFFDEVRASLGDQRFFGALGRYHTRFTGRFATGADLLAELEAGATREEAARIADLHRRWIAEAHGYEDLLADELAADATSSGR